MEEPTKSVTRKKILLLTVAAFCSATVLRLVTWRKKEKKSTVKMLAQDGRLVEIDKDLLYGSKRKITDPELKAWIKR